MYVQNKPTKEIKKEHRTKRKQTGNARFTPNNKLSVISFNLNELSAPLKKNCLTRLK